jgi:NitT/TauT family transport system substrate-binding protein
MKRWSPGGCSGRFLALAALVMLAIPLSLVPAYSAGAGAKRIAFLTNYVFSGRDAPIFVGVDKGWYRAAGFDVHVSPATGSSYVVSAVESGKAAYGMADASTMIQAVAKGAKVQGFSVYMDASPDGLASLRPYPTPQSLAGQTIAASLTDSARVIVPIILRSKGLDPSSIKWQAADPGLYYSLLLEGKVDLVTASIDGDVPALAKVATPRGKHVYFSSFSNWGYNVFGLFLVGSDADLAAHPAEARAFASATAKAVQYSIAHPADAARITVKYNPTMDYNTTLAQWQGSIKVMETPYVKQYGYGGATRPRIAQTIKLVEETLKLSSSLTPDDVYASGFITR